MALGHLIENIIIMALRKLKSLVSSLVMLLAFVYLIAPFAFKHSKFIQQNLLFMNHVNLQYYFNLSHPEQIGLKCTRTLRLDYISKSSSSLPDNKQDGARIELGVWHILPESSLHSCETRHETNRTTIEDKLAFEDSRPIVLYLHGNGGTRAGDHRSQLYKRLAYEFDYHIVTFDYRGYGDSTYMQPTADGLSNDAQFMYRWLLSQPNVNKHRVIVWGHSLGTAVAVRMVSSLEQPISQPEKLVLEAPFDSMSSAIANHPFSYPFRVMPYFENYFVDPIKNSPDLNFDTADRIITLKSTQIMILHAEDDAILPIKLGRNLYRTAVKALGKSKVQLVTISASFGLGHKHICNHDQTMAKVRNFLDGSSA